MTRYANGALMARVAAELALQPQTATELAVRIGGHKNAMSKALYRLRGFDGSKERRIHITGWVRTVPHEAKRHLRPVYAIGGEKPDQPMPDPISREEINRAAWAKHKAKKQQIESIPTSLQAWCLGTREVRI